MYAVVTNPLLPSENKPTRQHSFPKNMAMKWNESRMHQMLVSVKNTKRIVPSPPNNEKKTTPLATLNEKRTAIKQKKSRSASIDPEVYYNGSLGTLNLSQDRLEWMSQPSPAEDHLAQWPLPRSITQQMKNSPKEPSNSMALVYWRVLDVVNLSFSKASAYYCTVQIHDNIFTGKAAVSNKYGKHRGQSKINEIHLFDLDQASTVTFRLYKKIKKSILKGGDKSATEICLGQKEYHIKLRPREKQMERVTFQHGQDTYQVMIIRGIYMSHRAQSLVANQILYAGFITVYIRGSIIPRWQRYWGVLQATKLTLYDFEYKETKAAQVILPFDGLEKVFHPSHVDDDDEQLVDVGRLGLALQFTASQLLSYGGGNRMFVLPDDDDSCQGWEASFAYIASLVEEFKMALDDTISSVPRFTNSSSIAIPDKFLW